MKILTYRDLESKDDVLPLLDHAFNWVFDRRQFEDAIKIDPRLKNGPVGFFAVENERIIGHVGVMDLATRTLGGTMEPVGGVYGVATLPGFTRRGVSTALMSMAHQYFKEKDYRFSFLFTSHALVAHALYLKLGYVDLIEYPSAYKVISVKKAKRSGKGMGSGFDVDRIPSIYSEFSKDRTGFVVRDRSYLRMLKKVEGIKAKQCFIGKDGYVIFREDKSGIWIRELIVLDAKEADLLIDMMEKRTRGLVYDRAVLDKGLLGVYRSRGYIVQEKAHSVMMFKLISPDTSFKDTYGDKLYLSRLDAF
ncbi:MAG: GNAT family N-acetyltransferase [Candidatus Bathyarchaeia archaeon]|jgi:GNAT superfamily N-acetyltransferase